MSDDTKSRAEFEEWITAPPYEQSIERHPIDSKRTSWPGQYRYYATQLAWEAWRERSAQIAEQAAEIERLQRVVRWFYDNGDLRPLILPTEDMEAYSRALGADPGGAR